MDIKQYCDGRPDRVKSLATACGVTTATIYNWRNGRRTPAPSMWPVIVAASNNRITIRSLMRSSGAVAAAEQESQP